VASVFLQTPPVGGIDHATCVLAMAVTRVAGLPAARRDADR
jgi:hypothetical protein